MVHHKRQLTLILGLLGLSSLNKSGFFSCVTCIIGPMEVIVNDPRSREMTLEQWIQREWIEQNDLQVHLAENPQSNEIPEVQTLLGEGWSSCFEKRKSESDIWKLLN